jgi:hypothetical protein
MDASPVGIYKGYSCGLEGMPWDVGSGDRIFPAGESGPEQATAHKGTNFFENPVRDHPHAKWIFNPLRSFSLRRRDLPGSRHTLNNGQAGAGRASRYNYVLGIYAFGLLLFRPKARTEIDDLDDKTIPAKYIGKSANQCYKNIKNPCT